MKNLGFSHTIHSSASSTCEHCQGTTEHEPWCVTRDPKVYYAFEIVNHASKLTFADTLILHSLGVRWSDASV